MEQIAYYGDLPDSMESIDEVDQATKDAEQTDEEWLAIANDAFRVSDTFYNSSIRKEIDRNIDQFNSKHASGSKYATESYKYRSKIFRPKTRSSIRRHEAAAATAYFSSTDMVNCEAQYEGDEQAKMGAEIANNLVNGRLAEPAMRWFQTCLGAYQDAMVQGVVISKQDWVYKEKVTEETTRVIEDRFTCDIVPVENFRFDPNSDWRDPVSSSPYTIELIPMYRGDVKSLMLSDDSVIPWKELEEDTLNSGTTPVVETTNIVRNRGRQNPQDQHHKESDYDIIWIHANIIRIDDEDVFFYTLGETRLLSDPIPIEDVYTNGRPYRMGVCNLETHKTHPSSPVELIRGLQMEANDIANQRLDNVKLVVNRRSFVRRNAKIDLRSLTHSAPGGITLVEDVDRDVRHDAPQDVTSSAYAEQDRLNNDIDELSGSFSGSSVASNRQMNETVGGMEIMSADAGSVTDYQLRIFAETWLKPVLLDFVTLEKENESDQRRLTAASYGMEPVQALQALKSDILVKLSVGFGATNPQKQIEKLAYGLSTMAEFLPQQMQNLDGDEVKKEIFAALGYQDGKRFFKEEQQEDPEKQQLKQMIQELQQQLQTKQIEGQTKIQVETVKQQGNMQREQLRNQVNMDIAAMTQQIDYINQQIDAEKNDIKREEMVIQRDALEHNKQMEVLANATKERDRMSDVLMNDNYGLAPNVDEGAGPG